MSVKDTVEKLIDENKVVIFSKSWCGYSRRAKTLFSGKFPDVPAKVIELDETENGDAIQEYLREKTGQSTVPNIFINKKHLGGSDDAQAAFASGKLTQLVKA